MCCRELLSEGTNGCGVAGQGFQVIIRFFLEKLMVIIQQLNKRLTALHENRGFTAVFTRAYKRELGQSREKRHAFCDNYSILLTVWIVDTLT